MKVSQQTTKFFPQKILFWESFLRVDPLQPFYLAENDLDTDRKTQIDKDHNLIFTNKVLGSLLKSTQKSINIQLLW